MRQIVLLTLLLCFLSTQVFGSVAYESEHETHGDVHGFMHELEQPHSHDSDDQSEFALSYSEEAIEHVGQSGDCCVVGLLEAPSDYLPERKPSNAITWYASNWSAPYLQGVKPPPRA